MGLALAAGAAALAASSTGGDVSGNWIGAGHLVLRINGSTEPVDLQVGQLNPGQQSSVDEVVTADMAGVPAAALSLTVTGPGASPAAADQTLLVSYTDPLPQDQLGWNGTQCAPTSGFAHTTAMPSAAGIELGRLTPGSGVCVRFQLGLSAGAGNEAQDQGLGYSIAYHLQQSAPGVDQSDGARP